MHECPVCGSEVDIVSDDTPFVKVSHHDPGTGDIDTEYYCSRGCAGQGLSNTRAQF